MVNRIFAAVTLAGMSWESMVEQKIQEAMDAGAFDNLKGAGEPLPIRYNESMLAGDMWMAFRVMQNGGLLPAWLELAREIERDIEGLQRFADRHARHVASAARDGRWPQWRSAISTARDNYEEAARKVRRKQDRFNVEAPALVNERPALWVDRELERLDERALAAGAPRSWFAESSRHQTS
ncbi:hypothetical protein AYO38_04630 [bacterium SCGC AG-212-C10]|nr:hypothetical protein AYO38_04630 [bacterium SCGC AG-212-C10]